MNLGFSQIIGNIEAELKSEYLPGAIKWADDNFNGSWSNAMDRFDKSLSLAIERKDFALAQAEGIFYKETILDLIQKYKHHKQIDDTKSFLQSIHEHQ